MKANIFKYIFFMLVILLIGLAIYVLYIDDRKEITIAKNKELDIEMIKEINIGISGYDTINPLLSISRDVQYIDKIIFEPLLEITQDFKIKNCLAKEFSKINSNTYIVKLRDDKYWHDGEKFTAEDVIFTINNLKNSKVESIYKENVADIEKIEKVDDYTIRIILNKEVDFFEYMMCLPILASHAYDSNTLKSKTDIPIGTGTYKIKEIREEKIIIEKYNYADSSKIEKINLILKSLPKDLYVAFINKEIDFMITDNIKYEEYIGSIGYNIKNVNNREFDYLILNNSKGILTQKEIRQVVKYSIDKNKINYNIFYNKYKISDFPLGYDNYLYNYDNEIKFDINKAKNILIEKGWKLQNNVWIKNNKKLEFNLLVSKENKNRVIVAENIKEQLGEAGIIINIIKANDYQFNNYIKTNNYDIILTGNIISNNPNLETYFGDNNLSKFYNEEILNILNEIKNIEDQEDELKKKYNRIKEIYDEEVPFISLYFNSLFILSNKTLKGNLEGNWYNVYYNIDTWYKIKEN